MISEEELREAFDRIARTPDGNLVYRHLQKVLCGVVSIPADDNGSALRHDHGRRTFASELMGLMTRGIEESVGSDANRAIVFVRRQPDAGGKHVSAREYFQRQQLPAGDDR